MQTALVKSASAFLFTRSPVLVLKTSIGVDSGFNQFTHTLLRNHPVPLTARTGITVKTRMVMVVGIVGLAANRFVITGLFVTFPTTVTTDIKVTIDMIENIIKTPFIV
jgi:hypothetical protein